ncbi:MAG: M20/M25/M40 family metallo-hydrolase [Deltaproteobacteria bacterium]|nr:M20/M25/M40 family metallo-hydrolase [Deltaproteobacteria bacterium]
MLKDWQLNDERFLRVLGSMMAQCERLQNSPLKDAPPPQEDLAGNVVRAELEPFVSTGKLQVDHISYAENRGNLILTYPGRTTRTVAFVGAHLDVVPADPDEWQRPPFALQIEGDRLYGRGVTDCLGHVAVLTDFFAQLAEHHIELDHTVVAVIIVNEEMSNTHGVGINSLVKEGKLAHLKDGPLYWLDSANFGPTIGTGGMSTWRLVVEGKVSHSGFPQNGINAAELAFAATQALQAWFYQNYPPHPKEKEYGFLAPSSLKPTRVHVENDTISKIPAKAIIEGDIRLTPWYVPEEVKEGALKFINNLDVRELLTLGPSRYRLDDAVGTIKLEAIGAPGGGIACDRTSPGYIALVEAIAAVRPESQPFSLTGTLPYVRFLQRNGFDVQITGFGRMDTYHAPNEFAEMSHMRDGFRILCQVLARFG